MFNAIKRFIGWKKHIEEVEPPKHVIPDLGVSVSGPTVTPIARPPTMVDSTYVNNILKNSNNSVQYNQHQERGFMAEKYLVVLDTTNRPEVTDRGLKGGLKNFYFIAATNPDQAKQIVLSTFAKNPAIMQQIQYSLSVTPLGRISPHINENTPIWSYVPIRKGVVAPGQQATPPMQSINPNNRDEVVPMREPPAPITPPLQNDTPQSQAEIPQEARGSNPMAAMMSPTLPNGQPNPMFAMMQMMATMMQAQQPAAPVAAPPQLSVTRGDPDNDPELRRNMEEVRSTAVARHINHDPSAMDDELSGAEKKAAMEVENFKRNNGGKAGSSVLTSVTNDVDPALMAQMANVMGRMGNTPPADDTSPKKKKK